MFKYHRLFLLMLLLNVIVVRVDAIEYFQFKHIVLENKRHAIIKENKALHNIFVKYINKKITIQNLTQLRKKIQSYYSSIGYQYTKVLIPPQILKNDTLYLIIYIPTIGKIKVVGNKYYSKKFILERFKAKEYHYLKYNKMTSSLLMLNDYLDLNTKMLLKNNKKTHRTDIILKVKDKRPFHLSLQMNNLGSTAVSKNKININAIYGNLFTDGDQLQLYTTYALKRDKHNHLYMVGYNIPVNTDNTILNLGYFSSTYLVGGDFEDLGIEGDTTNYSIGITQPLFKTFKQSLNFSSKYTKKDMNNYILGKITSREVINDYDFSLNYTRNTMYAVNQINIGSIFGLLENNAVKTRENGSDAFIKFHFNLSRNQFINKKNSIIFTLKGQYSRDRLPTTEMYSIGGVSVKGFDTSSGMGDSGYSTSLKWMNNLFKYKYLSYKVGLFLNYGEVFKNNTIQSEYKRQSLLGYGIDTTFNIKNKYILKLSCGYPIKGDNVVYSKKLKLYATLDIILW